MRTPAQQAASRANAARSTGPRTAAGKRRSAQNALRHGLCARATVLENESRCGFDEMLRQYIQHFAPRDAAEESAVAQMCSAAWRRRRIWSLEREALELEFVGQASPDELKPTANVFDPLTRNSPQFLLLSRYETSIDNTFHRSLARLLARPKKCGCETKLAKSLKLRILHSPMPSDLGAQ
jgi:hypothetical protein